MLNLPLTNSMTPFSTSVPDRKPSMLAGSSIDCKRFVAFTDCHLPFTRATFSIPFASGDLHESSACSNLPYCCAWGTAGEQLQQALHKGVLQSVALPAAWERVAEVQIGARPAPDPPSHRLFLEIMGRHSNLVLTDGDRTILAAGYQA